MIGFTVYQKDDVIYLENGQDKYLCKVISRSANGSFVFLIKSIASTELNDLEWRSDDSDFGRGWEIVRKVNPINWQVCELIEGFDGTII